LGFLFLPNIIEGDEGAYDAEDEGAGKAEENEEGAPMLSIWTPAR
jgi:hypothetical protein